MALKQYRKGATYYGYDPLGGQAIAFSNPDTFKQHFTDFDPAAPELPIDAAQFANNTDKLVSVPKDFTGLAKRAGEAGINFGDLAPYLQEQPSEQELAGINQKLGIDELEKRLFTQPAKNTEQLYTDAYSAAGLSDIKKQFNDLMGKVNTKKGDLNKAIGSINENPWLSEASRLGRSRNLQELAQGDIENEIDQAEQISNLYNQALSEVNGLVSRQGADAANAQNLTATQLEYLLGKADKEAARLATSKNGMIARYLPEYLTAKTAADERKEARKAPETIGSNETGYFAWDPNTRSFRQVIAPKPKATDTYKWNEPLSPAEAEKLGVPYGTLKGDAAQMGITPQRPLSAEALKLQSNVQSGLRALNTVKDELFGTGSAAKSIDDLNNVRSNVIVRERSGMARNYAAAQREMMDIIVRLRTGAAISEQEEKFYKSQLPNIRDNEATVKGKLKRFEELFKSIAPERIQGMTAPDALLDEFESSVSPTSSTGSSVDKIAAAMRNVESNNNYNRKGASGEYGAYQFMPATWKGWAKQYLGNANAPMTPANQDKVAKSKIEDLLKQGYNAEQIALIWNHGAPRRVKGVNSMGVAYDSGRHADKVLAELKKLG